MKKRIWKIFGITTALTLLLVICTGALCLYRFEHSDAFVSFDKNKLNEVYTALTVLDDEGQVINEPLYLNKYKQIPLSALHDYTYMAFVAVEDKRFFNHDGVDVRRIAGAALHNLKSRSYKEGASTISQQLIKNTHLDNSKTFKRKLNEILLAKELEKEYSKTEILEMYVNTIYFGRSAYGIETAANVYFNKSATDLTVSESAVLAGMIKAPNVYAPDKNPDKCRTRRNTVLKLMSEQNIIDDETYAAALDEPITYNPQIVRPERNYVYSVMREACRLLNMTPLQLAKSDFVIETYCNRQTQKELCRLAANDSTKNKDGSQADLSAVVLNNDGGIQACILRGETSGSGRQAGSALKPPAVYAPALNEKIITQASLILDEETDFNGYKPTNAGGYNGWTTVKYAVAKSLNIPAVKTLNALTLPVSEKYLTKLGITGEQNLSLALGNANGGVDIFQLAKCYSAFANDGKCNDVGFIKNIYGNDGLIYSREKNEQRVFQSAANYLMTDMLVNTVETGTAKKLKNPRYQVAAKTGTVGNADGNTDALVAGYTTANTFVVWYSGELNNDINGATAPCAFANELLSSMYEEHIPSDFTPPSGVIRLDIDKENLYDNQLVTRCDSGEKFWFDRNNQPKDFAQTVKYDYHIDAYATDNVVKLTLPDVDGLWQLYRKTEGKSELMPLTDNAATVILERDETFYAELYVKNKLVYTTPSVTVYYVSDTEEKKDFRDDEPFPNLTDFWYWG